MDRASTVSSQSPVRQFVHIALNAIVRAEATGRLPQRLSVPDGQVWQIFRNELTLSDLVALAVQDVGISMPVPFDPTMWWPDWPDWALRGLSEEDVQAWLAEAKSNVQQPQAQYLQEQAKRLGLELLSLDKFTDLPVPAAHERWLELPGSAGWIAYAFCTSKADVYYWENFTILCQSPQEMLFAGLLAWELNAPPRQELPISLDPDLQTTLHSEQTYAQVLARHDLHGHRALQFLHNDGQDPLWIG